MILDPGKTSLSGTLNAVLKALNLYAHDVIRIRIRIKDKDRIRIRLK
jgi:small nuclear ribonucleoprotein (snRNP)-like protein